MQTCPHSQTELADRLLSLLMPRCLSLVKITGARLTEVFLCPIEEEKGA